MGAHELLLNLAARGIRLAVQDGRLVVTPASRLTDSDRDAIRNCRGELLALLAQDQKPDPAEAKALPPRQTLPEGCPIRGCPPTGRPPPAPTSAITGLAPPAHQLAEATATAAQKARGCGPPTPPSPARQAADLNASRWMPMPIRHRTPTPRSACAGGLPMGGRSSAWLRRSSAQGR